MLLNEKSSHNTLKLLSLQEIAGINVAMEKIINKKNNFLRLLAKISFSTWPLKHNIKIKPVKNTVNDCVIKIAIIIGNI